MHSVIELTKVSINGDMSGSPAGDLESVDNTAEKCHEFICGIIEGGADNSELDENLY